jgi:hypothetical protein
LGTALGIEVLIKNAGQIQLLLPVGSEQLLSVSSATGPTLFEATELDARPISWKMPDAFFGSTNLHLEEGQPPCRRQAKTEQGAAAED